MALETVRIRLLPMTELNLTTSDGARLWGTVEGSGPPVALCHGGPGLWDYFGTLVPELSQWFSVYRWDQRGCGRSEASDSYGLEVAISDVQEVKAAFGVEVPWVVLGHSWGAYLGLLSALEHPELTRALIYVSGTGSPGWWSDTGSALYKEERARRRSVDAQRRLAELAELGRTRDEEVEFRRLSWFTDFAEWHNPPPDLETMATAPMPINWLLNRRLSQAAWCSEADLLHACRQDQVPSLFIHGSEDPRPAEGAKRLCDEMPAGQFALIEGAGHFPWVERPEATVEVIRSFLAEVYR